MAGPRVNVNPPTAFHEYHGRNIVLFENNTVAIRKSGYSDGIVFSKNPLLPGEIFLLEILNFEHGWMGNLRIGLTQENPSSKINLSQFALPGLPDAGLSWIVPVRAQELSDLSHADMNQLAPTISENNYQIHTSRGSIPCSLLLPGIQKEYDRQHSAWTEGNFYTSSYETKRRLHIQDFRPFVSPADVGSRIGVTYVARGCRAEMYIIVNGDVYGPCASEIPYQKGPIYAVADLYGTTKQVRIVQTFSIPTLKMACRNAILNQVCYSQVYRLPLPKSLVNFLLFKS